MSMLIGPYHIIVLFLLYVVLFFFALARIYKKEKGLAHFIWIAIALFVPIFGALVYIFKLYATRKKPSLG